MPATVRFLSLLLLLLAATVCRADDDPAAAPAKRGREFLLRLIHPELHLLPEFAGHKVIWLYHDNYLAAKVLAATHPAESAKITAAIKSCGVEKSGKIELLFGGGKLPLRHYELRDVTKTGGFTIRSEFTTDKENTDFASYADLLCFLAIAEPDAAKARSHLDAALAMWDGTGFKDAATRHAKIYATYKLALALRAARRFQLTSPALTAIRERLLKMQAASGGWITDYQSDGTPHGMANVETTSLAILALEPPPPAAPHTSPAPKSPNEPAPEPKQSAAAGAKMQRTFLNRICSAYRVSRSGGEISNALLLAATIFSRHPSLPAAFISDFHVL